MTNNVYRGISASNVDHENAIRRFRKAYELEKSKDTDTVIRKEIHKIIRESVSKGKSKSEIIKELSKNDKFKKHESYFENWTNDQIKKFGVKIDIQNRDEER